MTAPDPRWPAALRSARTAAGLSLRQLSARVHYSRGYLHDLEIGRRTPPPDTVRRLADVLDAPALTDLLTAPAPGLTAEDADRLARLAHHPGRADGRTVDILAHHLACLRRLEDTAGPAAVLPVVLDRRALVVALADEASDRHRTALVDQLGQWEQFAGWLRAALGDQGQATAHYAQAMAAALEVDRSDLAATALSMRGHLAWQARRPGPLLSLTDAAMRQAAGPAVRAVAAQQLARGYALAGHTAEADRMMSEADELVAATTTVPPWMYFHDRAYLDLQRGIVHLLTGRPDAAIVSITGGLAGVGPDIGGAAWTGTYLVHLATAYRQVGWTSGADDALDRAARIAAATRSARLADQVSASR